MLNLSANHMNKISKLPAERSYRLLVAPILLLLILGACSTLPATVEPLPEQFALPPAKAGLLAEMSINIAQAQNAQLSGFHILDENAEALTWRLALIDEAVSSLDLMYYIWYADDSGRLLLDRVLRAANRGVRVRLVVDDLLLIGEDKTLIALNEHPNIQFRIFNPWTNRKAGRAVEFVRRMDDLNTRMHNKLLIADNHATILGGRNLGNHYFGLSKDYNFYDRDVLGIGPVAREASSMFDHFWNSNWVVSAANLPQSVDEKFVAQKSQQFNEKLQSSEVLERFSLEPRDWSDEFHRLITQLHLGTSEFIFDRIEDDELVAGVADSLGRLFRSADHEVLVTNAYIIPDQDFLDGMKRLQDKGVQVRILTNSLASHDVPAVNSHYQRWRKPILETGAELFELRPDADIKLRVDTPPVTSKFIGLHVKAFVVDRRWVFIGSMNFDPRSANINTEMGITIDSPTLGAEMAELAIRDMALENAWRLGLTSEGKLFWTDGQTTLTRQPARNVWQRIMDGFFKLFPESQF
jgi:putative cardiolipin synthase